MVVQSERDIDINNLLNQIQFYVKKAGKAYNIPVNKQMLIDCYDVIKASASEEDDAK